MADVEIVHSKVAIELRQFRDISKSLQYLVSQHHFDLLVNALSNIYQAEEASDCSRSLVLKEHLKVIVPCIINEVWGGSKSSLESKQPTKLRKKTIRKPPSPEKTPAKRTVNAKTGRYKEAENTQEKLRRRRSSPAGLLRDTSGSNFSRTLTGLSHQEAHSLSEFCSITGPASFPRSKRVLTLGHQESPGPAAYRADKSKLKANSPRAVIPQGGKKGELFQTPYSPGPSAYYVMRHFVSKPI